MNDEQTLYTLNIDLHTVNTILLALAQQPYAQVADTIDEIRAQVGPQFEAAQIADEDKQ